MRINQFNFTLVLQDAASQAVEEVFQLGDRGLRAHVTISLSVTFDTKCSAFELYKGTFEHLYRKRFQEMMPNKVMLSILQSLKFYLCFTFCFSVDFVC